MAPALRRRAVVDADADALVRLVGDAFAEYDGCVLDLDELDADLLAPASAAAAAEGRWWVLEDAAGRIVATVGAGAPVDGTVELKRLYVAASHRRQGLGADLVALVERHARHRGADRVELWSDTRFAAAHRLYRRLGYADTGRRRQLHDPSHTTEAQFVRPL